MLSVITFPDVRKTKDNNGGVTPALPCEWLIRDGTEETDPETDSKEQAHDTQSDR